MTMLAEAGLTERQKIDGAKGTGARRLFGIPIRASTAGSSVHFDSAPMRQMELGFRRLLAPGSSRFSSPKPRDFMPLVGVLADDHLVGLPRFEQTPVRRDLDHRRRPSTSSQLQCARRSSA